MPICRLCVKDTDNPPDVDGSRHLLAVLRVLFDTLGDEYCQVAVGRLADRLCKREGFTMNTTVNTRLSVPVL